MKVKSITPDKAKNAKRESKRVERKEKFDINQTGDWCEIIKDIVAMANSGGGCILVGVKNDGTLSGWDPTLVLNLDPADLTNKVAKYTGEQFDGFDITETEKDGRRLAVLQIRGVSMPMVFTKPGAYHDRGLEKDKVAFREGTIYFRHGAKSEPANSKDLQECLDREIERRRKSLFSNILKVMEAPVGSQIDVLQPRPIEPALPGETSIRIVDDPTVPAYREVDRDKTHPHRQTELLSRVNQMLGGSKDINTYDVLCARKVHKIDQTKPKFYHKPRYGSPQYSDAFVNWLVEQYTKDSLFFDKAREEYRRQE